MIEKKQINFDNSHNETRHTLSFPSFKTTHLVTCFRGAKSHKSCHITSCHTNEQEIINEERTILILQIKQKLKVTFF